jgi:hypothetical protein
MDAFPGVQLRLYLLENPEGELFDGIFSGGIVDVEHPVSGALEFRLYFIHGAGGSR